MVMKVEPLSRAIESARSGDSSPWTIYLTPQGTPFDQKKARDLSSRPHLLLVCGRYEGVDERVREMFVDEEISIGDYVMTGGELAAMVMMDAISRLLPGVLGSAQSAEEDSFTNALLDTGMQSLCPDMLRDKLRDHNRDHVIGLALIIDLLDIFQ